MTPEDLAELARRLRNEAVKRNSLGGYSTDAECLMLLCEAMHRITIHLIEISENPDVRAKKR